MKKIYFLGFIVILFSVLSLSLSCGLSTEELAKQVQEDVLEFYKTERWAPYFPNVEVERELVLVKISETQFTGMMTIKTDYERYQLSLDVLFDGKTFQWTVTNESHSRL